MGCTGVYIPEQGKCWLDYSIIGNKRVKRSVANSNTHKVEVSFLFLHRTKTTVAGGLAFYSSFNVLMKKWRLSSWKKETTETEFFSFVNISHKCTVCSELDIFTWKKEQWMSFAS